MRGAGRGGCACGGAFLCCSACLSPALAAATCHVDIGSTTMFAKRFLRAKAGLSLCNAGPRSIRAAQAGRLSLKRATRRWQHARAKSRAANTFALNFSRASMHLAGRPRCTYQHQKQGWDCQQWADARSSRCRRTIAHVQGEGRMSIAHGSLFRESAWMPRRDPLERWHHSLSGKRQNGPRTRIHGNCVINPCYAGTRTARASVAPWAPSAYSKHGGLAARRPSLTTPRGRNRHVRQLCAGRSPGNRG